jgi:hypothetical protein
MFEGLNHLCGAYIDDYEEDCIEPEQLDAAINFLRGQSYVHLSMNVETFKQQLIALLDYARLARRPVFFVF